MDDDHDGFINQFNIHYGMHDLMDKYGDLGEKAEDVYAFVWAKPHIPSGNHLNRVYTDKRQR